jgi:uncharacterized protein YcfL
MKKVFAIGALAVASLILVGCQQKPAEQQAVTQQETATATITVEEPQTSTSKATLEVLPSTEENAEVAAEAAAETTGAGTVPLNPTTTSTEAPLEEP